MQKTCPHCGEELPSVADPICSFCREEIDSIPLADTVQADSARSEKQRAKNDNQPPTRATFVACVVIALVFAAFFLPVFSLPLLAVGAMGFAFIRSAVTHRNPGWVSGVVFGAVLLVAGIGGFVGVVVKWRPHRPTNRIRCADVLPVAQAATRG